MLDLFSVMIISLDVVYTCQQMLTKFLLSSSHLSCLPCNFFKDFKYPSNFGKNVAIYECLAFWCNQSAWVYCGDYRQQKGL